MAAIQASLGRCPATPPPAASRASHLSAGCRHGRSEIDRNASRQAAPVQERQQPCGGAAHSAGRQHRSRWCCRALPQRPGGPHPGKQQQQPGDDHAAAEVLLDVTLAGATPAATCRAIFGYAAGGDSHTGLLAEFLGRLATDADCSASPWEDEDDGDEGSSSSSRSSSTTSSSTTSGSSASVLSRQRRRLCYSTPLSLQQRLLLGPLGGPAAVRNTEEQCLSRLQVQVLPNQLAAAAAAAADDAAAPGGIVVTSRCCSAGVPFADCFANHLEWRLMEEIAIRPAGSGAATRPGAGSAPLRSAAAAAADGGGGGTRVVLTASCRFHTQLPGAAAALQGLIQKESLEGMRRVYSAFAAQLEHVQLGAPLPAAPAVGNATASTCLSVGGTEQQQQQPTDADGSSSSSSWHTAQRMAQQLCPAKDPLAVVEQVAAAWPAWARSGYPVVDPAAAAAHAAASVAPSPRKKGAGPAATRASGSAPPAPPLPDETAALLGVVARRASLATPPAAAAAGTQQRPLARHCTIRGLVRALRLKQAATPPGDALPSAAGEAAAGGAASERGPLRLSPAAVGPTLWALAMLGGCEHWEAEAEALCALLPDCRFTSWYQVADVAWALATTRHHCRHLALLERQAADALQLQLEAVEEAAPAAAAAGGAEGVEGGDAAASRGRRLHKADLSLTQYACLVWGLAALDHPPTLLLGLFARLMRARDARGAARAAWRAATRPAAAAAATAVGTALAAAAAVDVGAPVATASSKRSFSALCTIAWSMAAAGELRSTAALPALLQELAGAAPTVLLSLQEQPQQQQREWAGGGPDGAQRRRLMQLHQFALALAQEQRLQQQRHHHHQTPLPPLEFPAALQQLLAVSATAWAAEGQRRRGRLQSVSACQADVAATAGGVLGALGSVVLEEHCVAGGFSVDLAVPARRLVVEVDGPTHFARNAPDLPLGATRLKRRLLQHEGWAVARVHGAHWEALRGGAPSKRRYLAEAVAAAEAERGLVVVDVVIVGEAGAASAEAVAAEGQGDGRP